MTHSLAWDDLRLINAIAAAHTLPAAAAVLGLDHSTVFRRLRQIEVRLGSQVFERSPSGYVPTMVGVEIVALAARVNEDITTVLRRIAGQSPSLAGEVRIATSDALLFDLVLPLLADFRHAFPDVRLDLVTSNTELNLSRRDADVAIRATTTPPETLVGRRVGRITWAAYRAASQMAPVSDTETFASDAIWVGFGDALSGLTAASYFREHVAEHRIGCRFDTVAGMAAGIEAGFGYGLLPNFVGDRHAALVRLLPPLALPSTDLWILTHADLRNLPRIRALMDFLGEKLASLRPLLEGQAEL